jgi:hypothetical protein
MKTKITSVSIALAFLPGAQFRTLAQGTALTYQGRLDFNGSPAAGSFDLRLAVFGTSTGGVFSVSGTIGQAEATANSALTGRNFSLTGGFWSLFAAQQTGFPTLCIRSAAPSTAVVFWQNTGSYTLQTNRNLATTNWADYGGSVSLINGTNNVTFAPAVGNLFFRLRQ